MQRASTSAYRGGSERDTRLYARQGRVASLGNVPWRMQVSLGAYPSFGKVEAAIRNCNHAGSLDGTKSELVGKMGMERWALSSLERRTDPETQNVWAAGHYQGR